MTPDQFIIECRRYFGAWPEDKPGIAAAVGGYIKTKRPDFLAALWPLVRDSRPAGYGPPDMAALMEHATRAAERMADPATKLLDDNEPLATPEDVVQAMAPVVKKIEEQAKESGYYRLNRPKPFGHLDGIRTEIEKEKS